MSTPFSESEFFDSVLSALKAGSEGQSHALSEQAFEDSSERDLQELQRDSHIKSLMHGEHMESYVSTMRIRYAWAIFSLLLFWLLADLAVILISACGWIDMHAIFSFVGGGYGYIVGSVWGYACRNRRNLRDIKAVFQVQEKQQAFRLSARNIQLRIWRSTNSAPISLGCMALGAALFWGLSYLVAPDAVQCKISDTIVIAMITTTTASVISIFIIVLHWLFPKGNGS